MDATTSRLAHLDIRTLPMADEDLRPELERLRRENEALKQVPKARVTMKGSDKGGLSVYGIGRFPVTLYKE